MSAPRFDDDLCLLQIHEEFAIQQIIPKFAVEAFAIAIFPGASRLNVLRLHTKFGQPFFQDARHELWAVIRTQITRQAVSQKQIRQHMHDLLSADSSGHVQRQALPAVFVNDHQHAKCFAMSGAALDKITGPYMMPPFRTQADAGAAIAPEPFARALLCRDLRPSCFQIRSTRLSLMPPPIRTQKIGHGAIPIPTMSGGVVYHRLPKQHGVLSDGRGRALRRPILAENRATFAFAGAQGRLRTCNALPAPGGAQKFPLAASDRIAFSRLKSATTRRNRAFSFSSSLSCSVPIPPYSLRQR